MQTQITQAEIEQATVEFVIAKADRDTVNKNFEHVKKSYYAFMDKAFDSGMYGDATSIEFNDQLDSDTGVKDMLFKATRVVPTHVSWDPNKLKKKLPDEFVSDVIKRQRDLVDLQGLVNYMRSLGGNAKKFWSFFNTTEFVDTEQLDQLFDLGEIEWDDVSGCYSVSTKPSQYRVTSKEIEHDDEGHDVG